MATENLNRKKISVWQPYIRALAVMAIAVLARYGLDPLLGERLPYLAIYAGVGVAIWVSRWKAAAIASAAGFLASTFFFLPPRSALVLDAPQIAGFLAFLCSSGAIIYVGEMMHRARDLAEQDAHRLEEEIARREQAEAAARERENFAGAILHSITDGFVTVDKGWRYTFVNEDAARLMHKKPAELLGCTIWEVFQRSIGTNLEKELRRAMTERVRVQFEYFSVTLQRWFSEIAYPLSDGGLAIYFADITGRRLMQEALLERERELESVISGTPFALTRCTRDFRYRFVSRAYAEMVNLSAEEITGRKIVDVIGESAWETIRPYVEEVLAGKRVEYESEIFFARAGTVTCHVVYEPDRDAQGNIIGWIASIRDVTERRSTERALRHAELEARERAGDLETVLAAVPMPIWICYGNDSQRVVGNSAANHLFRVPLGTNLSLNAPPPERINFHVFRHGVELEPGDMPLARALREGTAIRNDELEFVFPDGRREILLLNAVPLLDQGRTRGAIASAIVITERKRAEERMREMNVSLAEYVTELQRANLELELARRAKDQFLATLSHELRTPLTPVLVTVSSLQRGDSLSPAAVRGLEVIRRNIEIQARMINDLLDLSRIIHDKLELALADEDAHEIIRRAFEVCAPAEHAKQLRIVLELNANSHHVRADATRLQQVFWNLIQNAIKFTPAGGQITVRSANENGRLRISVSDTGCGISRELLSKIFEPFEQVHRRNGHGLQGLGLGLPIAQRIVSAHGGTLVAHSNGENSGATFTVELDAIVQEIPVTNGALRLEHRGVMAHPISGDSD